MGLGGTASAAGGASRPGGTAFATGGAIGGTAFAARGVFRPGGTTSAAGGAFGPGGIASAAGGAFGPGGIAFAGDPPWLEGLAATMADNARGFVLHRSLRRRGRRNAAVATLNTTCAAHSMGCDARVFSSALAAERMCGCRGSLSVRHRTIVEAVARVRRLTTCPHSHACTNTHGHSTSPEQPRGGDVNGRETVSKVLRFSSSLAGVVMPMLTNCCCADALCARTMAENVRSLSLGAVQ